jgi:hypothetical protein
MTVIVRAELLASTEVPAVAALLGEETFRDPVVALCDRSVVVEAGE